MSNLFAKSPLVCLLILLAYNTCFAQFTNSNLPRHGRIKGKLDSVVISYFNIKRIDTGESRELNDRCTDLYNAKGFLIEERLSDFDSTDSRVFRTVYSYDDKGNYSQVLEYNLSGKLKGKELYSFDLAKRLVEVRSGHYKTTTMLLDKAGNIFEDTNYQVNYPTPFAITRCKYNRKGLCTESVETSTNSPKIIKVVYAYNAVDNLIEETAYENSALLSSYTFTYAKFDKNHNWLIQKEYVNGELHGINERQIVYAK